MLASQALGGSSRCGRVLGPSLDKIVKNVAWRKHSHIVAACKSALNKLETLLDSSDPASSSPLFGISFSDAELLLQPLLMALDSGSAKVVEPALDCLFRLFSSGLIRCEIDRPSDPTTASIVFRIVDSACKCSGLGDEAIELALLKLLLSAVRSPCILIRGDFLLNIVRTCYNVYLGGLNGTNQICAKAVLAQMVVIIFARVEEDSMLVDFKTVSVSKLLEFTDRSLNEGSSIHFVQNFISEIVEVKGDPDSKPFALSLASTNPSQAETSPGNQADGEMDGAGSGSGGITTKIREDGFLLFKNLCKLSMKFSAQDQTDDQILLRGKILSLELLKVIIDDAGPVWRNNDRFHSAIKQYLCLSLLKNSALSVMTIFQILCSIFKSLLSKFRAGLKAEIGIFFPMLILRVLENILQPSFLQKMTVLNFLEKIAQDSQVIMDIFVNYDCDVDSPNLFERTVNGLLKTALGPPPGSTTTLSPSQDATFRLESVNCLVKVIESMGIWMDQQLKIRDSSPMKGSFSDSSPVSHMASIGEEGILVDAELNTEANSEVSDAALLEQRRAYKLELQKGVSLFNRKPSKGIDYLISTKKVGDSPEAVAAFLKNTVGLNEAMIGDYLGDREEFPLKTMHAYVDSFNFEGRAFGEAIRYFLRGFRLPGEAQKIDRIMEKFAERFCKCNPDSFSSADTAYVLAYSVILLNTDAHSNMVKEKMTKADFIRNNRGINDGKDLPEEYLVAIYDEIVKNEIRMSSDSSAPQSKNNNSLNKLLGLDGILNLVWKQTEEKPQGANGLLVKHIQEQFKAKSGKSESVYYAVADTAILRFMMEVCWGPMLAAFSMTLDQSDDRAATFHCLQGFRHAVHVTAVTGMQTQRDAFVTTVAKFTYLHCAADMKQKNVDAVKAIMSIAIEDGNNLQDAWEHILTCLSRFEHLQLLGEGVPSDSSFFTAQTMETEEKTTTGYPSMKKKGTLQNPAMAAAVRGGSYDSSTRGVNTSGLVTQEQMTNFIANLNLLDQIGNFELNHIFAHSQRLNSEAIVAFVKALCKVSMSELQSPTDPRVFSLTKIVEVAHYNMNRIRLVWSRIWSVLSDFFVNVGLSENLSVEIFVMDSLRQLAMKFLEREELANYNFQNEFLRPFVIIMQNSNSAEIRELIVRCISQMVLSRVNNVKSGWKSVFMVFTAAAADERKNIVLLAFETMEKIVREYFPYITETEAVTFTDCVKCLITFTNSKFNSDVSLNAIAFLRFCAVKLADGGLESNDKPKDSAISVECDNNLDGQKCTHDHDHTSFWIPLLTGLSSLTADPRSAIRKSSLEVLFNILKDHGHIFSPEFWESVLNSIVFPMFSFMHEQTSRTKRSLQPEGNNTWDSETCVVAVQCLVDLFISFFDLMRSQLPLMVSIFGGFIKSAGQGPGSTGVTALIRLASELGDRLTEDEWGHIFLSLKEVASSSLSGFLKLARTMDAIDGHVEVSNAYRDSEFYSDNELTNDDSEDDNLQTAAYVVSRMKSHITTQLLILQVITDLCRTHRKSLSPKNTEIVLDVYSLISSHAHSLNSDTTLHFKLQKACSSLDISEPPTVHFENESYQSYLNFLIDSLSNDPSQSQKTNLEICFVYVCEQILEAYLNCSGSLSRSDKQPLAVHWILPLSSVRREELAARTPLVVSTLQAFSSLERESFRKHVSKIFPLLVDLVRSEHSSRDVQRALSFMFTSCIGRILMDVV